MMHGSMNIKFMARFVFIIPTKYISSYTCTLLIRVSSITSPEAKEMNNNCTILLTLLSHIRQLVGIITGFIITASGN
jgi:hypothetical protein